MDAQQAVGLALKASIFLAVFSYGLQSTGDDVLYPARRPRMAARALLAMFVVMPFVAVLSAVFFAFHPAVEIALLALAVSPMPPLLLNRQAKAGGRIAYGIGLMVTAAVLSVLYVPVALSLIGRIVGLPIALPPGAIVRLALISVLLPLGLGMLVRAVSPGVAPKLAKWSAIVALASLALTTVALLAALLPTAVSLIGNGTVLIFTIFVVVGLVVGHALGGPNRDERSVLALSTACRHPAIAIAIASANFPHETLVPAAVVLYLLVNVLISVAYIVLQRRKDLATGLRPTG
jgi:bile acid:Na+ symporter, BASS family